MADAQKNILINIDLETGNVNSQLEQIDNKIGSLGNNVNVQSFKSIRSEIREAREEAIRLAIAIEDAEASGENIDRLSQRYAEVTNRAAQLSDAVEDVNNSISNANPDNRLQGLVSIAQGAITAIQGVAGAFALIGVDAETAQVAVARLQGLIALTDAISSIDKITKGYQDLVRVLNFAAVAQRANNVATAAAVAVQRLFTSTVVATGTAFRALRLAIAATGIGLLVVAIAGAVVAIKSFIDATNDAKKASEDFNTTLDSTIEKYDDLATANQRAGQLILAELKAQGASEAQQRAAQLRNTENQLRIASERVLELQRQFNEALAKRRTGILGFFLGSGITEEDLKKASDAIKTALDDQTAAQNNVRIQEANNRAADLADQQAKNRQKIQSDREATNRRKQLIEELNQFIREQSILVNEINEIDAQKEINRINRTFDEKEKIARAEIRNKKQLDQTIIELDRLREAQILKIRQQAAQQSARLQTQIEIDTSTIQIEAVSQQLVELNNLINNSLLQDGVSALTARFSRSIRTGYIDIITDLFDINLQARTKLIEQDAELQKTEINNSTLSAQKKLDLIKSIDETTVIQLERLRKQISDQRQAIFNETIIFFDEQKLKEANQRLAEVVQRGINLTFNRQIIQRQNEFNAALNESLSERNRLLNQADKDYASATSFLAEQLQKNLITQKQFDVETIDATIELNRKRAQIVRDGLEQELQIRKTYIDEVNSLSPLISARPNERSFARNFISTEENRRVFDITLKQNEDFYTALVNQENAAFIAERDKRIANNQEIESLEQQHAQNLLDIENNYASNVQLINDAVLTNKLSLVNSIGDAIGNLGRLFKQGSREAKVAAIAEIAINTATGFVQGLDLAQKTARSAPPPAIPFVFAAFYASQIASVLGAAARAKQILAKVDGPQPASESAAAQTPSAISSTLFNLPPEAQNVRVVNQQSQVVRAFITNEDLRTAQEKQNFLNKLSSF